MVWCLAGSWRLGSCYLLLSTCCFFTCYFFSTLEGHVFLRGFSRGYAFGSDHPDWPTGLLGGYRWGTINPSESKKLVGKIYLFKGGLNDLRLRYTNDFK